MLRLLSLISLTLGMTAGAAAQQAAIRGASVKANIVEGRSVSARSEGDDPGREVSGVDPTVCAAVGAPSWCSATLITSQSAGTGYTGAGKCAVAGGVTSDPSTCEVVVRNGGLYVSMTSLGTYTSPPTAIAISGATGGSGFSARLGTGNDLGFWINAAFAYCHLACQVHIPAGSYTYTTGIVMTKPSQSLVGDGPGAFYSTATTATKLTYSGSGDGIFWQMVPFQVAKSGMLRDFYLECTSAAANCIHSGTLIGSTWENLQVSGATGANASNILLENASNGSKGWTERTYMHNVWVGNAAEGGTYNLQFAVNGGNTSFAYSDISVWQSVERGQHGVTVSPTVYMYNSQLDVRGNVDSTNSATSFFWVNFGQIVQSRVNINGESVAGPHQELVYINGQLYGTGAIQMYAPDALAINGLLVPPSVGKWPAWLTLEPFNAFDYPLGQPVAKGFKLITADTASVVVAQGQRDLSGTLWITWPNSADRYQAMELHVSCASAVAAGCMLSVLQNYAVQGNEVIRNPRLVEISSGVVQLLVDVGNRNAIRQNLVATWFGDSNETINIFPEVAAGTTAVSTNGFFVDASGNLAFTGHLNQESHCQFSCTCTMAASTTCTITLSSTAYATTPVCIATVQGTTAIAAACSVSGNTVKITAASSNSLTWGAMLVGNIH